MKRFCKRVLPVLFCFALLLSGFCTVAASAYSYGTVTVGKGKTSIGPNDLKNYSTSSKIKIAEGVTEIQDKTFYYSDVSEVSLPNSLKSIGDSAFNGCKNLEKISIPIAVTHIGTYAFQRCTQLTEITIPENVTTIGDFAFAYCDNLTTVYFNATNCKSVSDNETYTGWFGYQNNVKKLVIGLYVKNIPQAAFRDCSKLEKLTIPANVKSIEESAFEACTKLKSVTLEEGLERIDRKAFYGCKALTEITVPNSVTYIGKDAFANCNEDLKINIEDESLLEPDDRNFGLSTDALIALIVLIVLLIVPALTMNVIYLVGCVKLTRLYCRKKQKSAGGLTALAVILSLLGFGFWYLLIIAIINHGEKTNARVEAEGTL